MQNLVSSALAGNYFGVEFRYLLGIFLAEQIAEMRYSKSGGSKPLPEKKKKKKKKKKNSKNTRS